jgi:hypothetical protein
MVREAGRRGLYKMDGKPVRKYIVRDFKAWEKRQKIWRHNSFFGHCRMAQRNMDAIAEAVTTTDKAMKIAMRIYVELEKLSTALKTRKE